MVQLSGDAIGREDLELTYGYAGSLGEHPPYSRFDIRDEVCEKVGGFLHGQVVKDRSNREFVVVGVKPAEGTPRLWFHPRDLKRPGAGTFPDDSAASLREKLTPVGPFSRAARDARAKLAQAAPAAKPGRRQVSRHLCESLPEDFDAAEDSEGEEVVLCCQCRLPMGDFAYTKEEKAESLVHADCMARLMQHDFKGKMEDRRQKAEELKVSRRADFDIGWKPADMIPRNLAPARRLKCDAVGRGLCCLMFRDGSDTLCLAPAADPAGSINLEYLSLALQVRFKEGTEPRFSLDPVDPAQQSSNIQESMQQKRFEPEWLAGTSVGEVLFQADYHLKELSMGEYEQPVVGMKSCLDFSEEDKTNQWRAREWFIVRKAEVQVSEDNVVIPCVKMGVEAREQRMGALGLEDARITRDDHPLVKYAEEFTHNFDLIAERKSVVYHLRELAKASVLAKYLLETGVNLDEFWFNLAGEDKKACHMDIPQLWNERCYSRVHVQDGQIKDTKEGFSKGGHSLYGGVQFGLDIFKIYSAQERQVQGVDLNLDKFSLSGHERVSQRVAGGAGAAVGKAFWSSLGDGSKVPLSKEDRQLFRCVFNPSLSDRRDEGDLFVPPCATAPYLRTLRKLVEEEEAVQQRRRAHFLSSKFSVEDAGPLFPSSWATSFMIEHGQAASVLQARPDYQAKVHEFEQITLSTVPTFDRTTEDGVRYRIYRQGSLEVRTTQEHDGKEAIGMVFSIREPEQGSAAQAVQEQQKITKVTEYVERGAAEGGAPLDCHSYLVLETEAGHEVLTEMLRDGKVSWKVNPEDLQDRNTLAKVIRSEETNEAASTLRDVKSFTQARQGAASCSERRYFVQAAFARAAGRQGSVESGFRRQAREKWWLAGSGAQTIIKEKKRRDYADKTYTIKFIPKKDSQRYTKEQYKELRDALRILVGLRGQADVSEQHESVYGVRVR